MPLFCSTWSHGNAGLCTIEQLALDAAQQLMMLPAKKAACTHSLINIAAFNLVFTSTHTSATASCHAPHLYVSKQQYHNVNTVLPKFKNIACVYWQCKCSLLNSVLQTVTLQSNVHSSSHYFEDSRWLCICVWSLFPPNFCMDFFWVAYLWL
jgi:hypothetical protein